MFKTQGKEYKNRPAMMRENRMAAKSEAGGAGKAMEKTDPLQQPGDEMGEDPHQVMQEHGPAMETHTMHPQEGGGMHQVMSMHPDGHEHRSEHADGKKAHEHAACLSGNCSHGGEMGGETESEPEFE